MSRNYKAEYARRKDLRAGEKHMIVYQFKGKWTELYGHDCHSLTEMQNYVKHVGDLNALHQQESFMKVVPRT